MNNKLIAVLVAAVLGFASNLLAEEAKHTCSKECPASCDKKGEEQHATEGAEQAEAAHEAHKS